MVLYSVASSSGFQLTLLGAGNSGSFPRLILLGERYASKISLESDRNLNSPMTYLLEKLGLNVLLSLVVVL